MGCSLNIKHDDMNTSSATACIWR